MLEDGRPAVSHDRDSQGNLCVRIRGEIDMSNVGQLATAVDAALGERSPRIVIDLSETTFMDGAAVSEIIRLRQAVPAEDCSIVLHHPKPIVLKLLAVLGLDDLCAVEGHREEQATP